MDNEQKGTGNMVNYKYRMHDVRIGRFFSVDPLTAMYPHYTPYSFSGNKVIHAIELEGLEEILINEETGDYYDTRHGKGTVSCLIEAPKMGPDGWDRHKPQYWPGYKAPRELWYLWGGTTFGVPLLVYSTPYVIGEFVFMSQAGPISTLPAVKTYLTGLGTATAYSRFVAGFTDYTGQGISNTIAGYDSRRSFYNNVYRGFSKNNLNSTLFSTLSPETSFISLFTSGLISNAAKYSTSDGWQLGSSSDIVFGTVGNILYGQLGGKSGDGFNKLNKRMRKAVDVKWEINNLIRQRSQLLHYGGLDAFNTSVNNTWRNAMDAEYSYFFKRHLGLNVISLGSESIEGLWRGYFPE